VTPAHPSDQPAQIAAAYAECERIMVSAAKNFSYGIRLLTPDKRGALAAVYALARRIDDIGDGTLAAAEKLRLLDDARRDIKAIGGPTSDPVLLALGDAASRLPIPVPAFLELVEGCELDVRGATYETFPDLVHYCRCVAGSIGRLCLGVFGARDMEVAPTRADTLGIALQQTNILRDIREDLLNGRVYLPAEELRRFGVDLRVDDDGALVDEAGALSAYVRFVADRARAWYDDGLQLVPLLDRRSAACCSAMSGIYRRLLDRIGDDPSLIRDRRLSLSGWAKTGVALNALVGAGR